jgi:hypothetical protein
MALDLPGAWNGWKLQKTGKRKEESLIAPDGTEYAACEVLELRKLQYEVIYLQTENRKLKEVTAKNAMHLTAVEISTLQETAAIIEAALPKKREPRFPPIRKRSSDTHDSNHRPDTSTDRF